MDSSSLGSPGLCLMLFNADWGRITTVNLIRSLITHSVTCHGDERAPHGRRDGDHVVDDAFVLGVGDVGDAEDVAHRVREPLQTAPRLLGFGHH